MDCTDFSEVETIETLTSPDPWTTDQIIDLRAQTQAVWSAVAVRRWTVCGYTACEKVVGYVLLERLRDGTGCLHRLRVHPHYRGQHVGSMLMDATLQRVAFCCRKTVRTLCEPESGERFLRQFHFRTEHWHRGPRGELAEMTWRS